MSLESFADLLPAIFGFVTSRSGGRKSTHQDMPSLDVDVDSEEEEVTSTVTTIPQAPPVVLKKKKVKSYLQPCAPQECRLTIVQITDVYTLDNFASLKTLLETIRSKQQQQDNSDNNVVVSMLTGDFLSPYLLSSVDRGAGMMDALALTPMDILTWGNHEADIDHRTVCKHAKNFPGIWINSNMQSHDAMKYQVPYHIVQVPQANGSVRKIGLVAVLSNDPKLYAHFKAPGAFGGAKIEDPWETLRKYEKILKEEHGCDLVLPLEHLYVPENHKTCQQFDFPVILSGHDHHRVDQVVHGTRLIKPGMDGVYATVLELVWNQDAPHGAIPKIRSSFVEVAQFEPDPILKKRTDAAYDVLQPLRNTELAGVMPRFEPLSSKNARSEVCTMGKLICSMIKASLEQTRAPNESKVDAVILMGGNIRGGEDYDVGSFFSLEMLEAEIKSDEVIGVVQIPGHVLAAGIEVTHVGDPKPGWMQYDDGIQEELTADGLPKVTHVAGQVLDPNRMYRIATKISDLTGAQSPPLKEYYTAHTDLLPTKGDYINIQSELMGFFARNLWRKLWDATGAVVSSEDEESSSSDDAEVESRLRLSVLDRDGDGIVTVSDIQYALQHYLGLSVHQEETTLAQYVHSYADIHDTGEVTVEDFETFCTAGLPREIKQTLPKKLAKIFPEPVVDELPSMVSIMSLSKNDEKGLDSPETTPTLAESL